MDSRLPPDVDPDRQLQRIRAHLDERGFEDIEIRRLAGYPSSQTSVEAPLVRAALGVFEKWVGVDEVWPRNAGSAPFHHFTERLGLDLISAGLGHGSQAHAPDEFMLIEPAAGSRVAGLGDIEKAYVDLLFSLADD
jgi:acetylornithine deacetylase/succinyl-diaminopimelate desuccinylase-like protein